MLEVAAGVVVVLAGVVASAADSGLVHVGTVDPVVAVFRLLAPAACIEVSFFSFFVFSITISASARLGRLAKRRPISAKSGGDAAAAADADDDDDSLSCFFCGETRENGVVVVKSWQLPPARSVALS